MLPTDLDAGDHSRKEPLVSIGQPRQTSRLLRGTCSIMRAFIIIRDTRRCRCDFAGVDHPVSFSRVTDFLRDLDQTDREFLQREKKEERIFISTIRKNRLSFFEYLLSRLNVGLEIENFHFHVEAYCCSRCR